MIEPYKAKAVCLLTFKVLTLARFKTRVSFINHVKTTLTTHNLAIAVTVLQRFQRAANFHRLGLVKSEFEWGV
jgi:hypothetical protein